ncbi:unnamed protein product [Orchesella dallaii]|uniref:RING-type E3 ubiquitin transferase n=1 Tax=Orchesella dallaii TaxID=48710 RepID=A0ABP1R6A8_9HEXA
MASGASVEFDRSTSTSSSSSSPHPKSKSKDKTVTLTTTSSDSSHKVSSATLMKCEKVTTKVGGEPPGPSKSKTFKPPENWVDAPEFVPSWLASSTSSPKTSASSEGDSFGSGELPSYSEIVGEKIGAEQDASSSVVTQALPILDSTSELCPYAMVGECRYGYKCVLLHGLKCDYCGQSCLHPSDATQRERHMKECVEQHEKDMELSFAVARSIDKICGICYEKVMSKNPPGEQRFGILPSCAHCYCLSCIRRWRQARQFDNKIIRACPECRVTSDFVCPSRYWVDSKEEKEKLIESYKVALSKKPCRYYRNGEGQCPFGNKCFYLHALPNGTVVDVGPPRRISGAQGRVRTTAQTLSIWEYIEEWEMQWLDIEDFMGMFDSDTTSEFSLPDMDDDLDGDDELFLDWDRM